MIKRISVMLPTRGRPEALKLSLESLNWRANHPDRVEYLLAVDPGETVPDGLPKTTRVWHSPERYGYSRLHEYYNYLAAHADSEWLFLWNDDALMHTYGWDSMVSDQEPGHLWPHIDGPDQHCNAFPIWPTEWARVIGHVSGYMYCDSWMQEVGDGLGMQRRVPIEITHQQPDDATFREGRGSNPWIGPPPNSIAEDIAKLRAHLEAK